MVHFVVFSESLEKGPIDIQKRPSQTISAFHGFSTLCFRKMSVNFRVFLNCCHIVVWSYVLDRSLKLPKELNVNRK